MPPEPTASAISGRKLSIVGVVAGIILVVVVVTGIVAREKGDAHLREWTETQSIPTVAVAPPGARR